MSNKDNLNNSKNQNTVGENSNNFVNDQNPNLNKKTEKPKKISKKESALRDIEKLKLEKSQENSNLVNNEKTTDFSTPNSKNLPIFKTEKEFNKQLKREVRKNKESRQDVLDRQERQLRAHLRNLEIKEQERREKLQEQQRKLPNLEPKAPEVAEQKESEKQTEKQQAPIKSLDDLISITQASKKKKEAEAQQKAQEEYTAKLLEQEKEALGKEGDNFLQEKQTILNQLKRIEQSREETPEEEEEKKKRRGIFWWIFILLLTALVAVLGYFVLDAFRPVLPEYISISVKLSNAEDVFVDKVTGELLKIDPGDSFPLEIELTNNSTEGKSLFVRYKVVLAVTRADGVTTEYPQYINVFSDEEYWHQFNAEEEKTYQYGREETDHFVYYVGILETDETISLTEKIEFDLYIPDTDENGQKFAGQEMEIMVVVESVNYFPEDGSYWETAPRAWVNKITDIMDQREAE